VAKVAEGLIAQAVVVLDQVNSARGKAPGQQRQLVGRKTHGLIAVESSGRLETPNKARSPARPKRGPRKRLQKGEPSDKALQAETLLEADVAVEDVEELGQLTTRHVIQKRDQRPVRAPIRTSKASSRPTTGPG